MFHTIYSKLFSQSKSCPEDKDADDHRGDHQHAHRSSKKATSVIDRKSSRKAKVIRSLSSGNIASGRHGHHHDGPATSAVANTAESSGTVQPSRRRRRERAHSSGGLSKRRPGTDCPSSPLIVPSTHQIKLESSSKVRTENDKTKTKSTKNGDQKKHKSASSTPSKLKDKHKLDNVARQSSTKVNDGREGKLVKQRRTRSTGRRTTKHVHKSSSLRSYVLPAFKLGHWIPPPSLPPQEGRTQSVFPYGIEQQTIPKQLCQPQSMVPARPQPNQATSATMARQAVVTHGHSSMDHHHHPSSASLFNGNNPVPQYHTVRRPTVLGHVPVWPQQSPLAGHHYPLSSTPWPVAAVHQLPQMVINSNYSKKDIKSGTLPLSYHGHSRTPPETKQDDTPKIVITKPEDNKPHESIKNCSSKLSLFKLFSPFKQSQPEAVTKSDGNMAKNKCESKSNSAQITASLVTPGHDVPPASSLRPVTRLSVKSGHPEGRRKDVSTMGKVVPKVAQLRPHGHDDGSDHWPFVYYARNYQPPQAAGHSSNCCSNHDGELKQTSSRSLGVHHHQAKQVCFSSTQPSEIRANYICSAKVLSNSTTLAESCPDHSPIESACT